MQDNEIGQAVSVLEKKTVVVVTTVAERINALDLCKQIKTRRSGVVEFFRDTKDKAHKTWKAIVAQEKGFTDRLDSAECKIKTAVMSFDRDQEAIRQTEQRRLQGIADETARKEREKQEQAAARQRAIEEEARQKAEAARKAAEQANAAERAQLLRKAEAAERKANAAAIKVEAKQEQAAMVAAPVIQVAQAAPKVDGASTRKTWKARVVDETNVPREFLMVNEKALDAYAKATKGKFAVGGVEFYEQESMAIRK